ncbi:uncharacterized protein LODBEIA_P10230 [Lodderomyces beijingensis]|uniref:tRNA-binding domain-containing protein n=1 Tax=Lodderomyces beijingensis TaxID=1775926 RepID=A0ABP0ZG32_9ASCO
MKSEKLRGEASQGMILAAEKEAAGNTIGEPVLPPQCPVIGERLFFDDPDRDFEPPKLKSKVWEYLQPKLKTNERSQPVFGEKEKVLRGTSSDDFASVQSLANAIIK